MPFLFQQLFFRRWWSLTKPHPSCGGSLFYKTRCYLKKKKKGGGEVEKYYFRIKLGRCFCTHTSEECHWAAVGQSTCVMQVDAHVHSQALQLRWIVLTAEGRNLSWCLCSVETVKNVGYGYSECFSFAFMHAWCNTRVFFQTCKRELLFDAGVRRSWPLSPTTLLLCLQRSCLYLTVFK